MKGYTPAQTDRQLRLYSFARAKLKTASKTVGQKQNYNHECVCYYTAQKRTYTMQAKERGD